MSALLEVRDLHAGYGRAEVLHGLSFSAAEKSVVTVIGPNGAGKSTLLGALMGLIPSRSSTLRGWRPKKLGDKRWRDGMESVYARFPRLKERSKQAAGTLSGGERQMLALGRALMGQPKLLMLDEPSLGLAPLIVREIFTIVDDLRASGVSILLVEQNARAALRVADHGHVLETGEFGLSGPADQLAADPRVIETYLGAGRKDS
jgi:branched-chain amino acid transport system ATP-binding protein